jgi:hypothetical protein
LRKIPALAAIAASVLAPAWAMAAVASDKAHQAAGMIGVYFFAGRILKVYPGFDFATGLKAEASKMTQPILQSELKRCGPMVEQVGVGMRAAQQSLAPRPPTGAAPAGPAPQPQPLVPLPGTGPAH